MKKSFLYKGLYYLLGLVMFVLVGYLSVNTIIENDFFQILLGFLCFLIGLVFFKRGLFTDGGTNYEKRNAADPQKAFLLVASSLGSTSSRLTKSVPDGIYKGVDKNNKREFVGKKRQVFGVVAAIIVVIIYLFLKFNK
jgi:uncharacterized membrane protein YfcA